MNQIIQQNQEFSLNVQHLQRIVMLKWVLYLTISKINYHKWWTTSGQIYVQIGGRNDWVAAVNDYVFGIFLQNNDPGTPHAAMGS